MRATAFMRTFEGLQRPFRRARPGTVLILVVAVLVLLALIGVAFLSVAMQDRVTSQQHTWNTQIDLLVEAVANQSKGAVVEALFQGGKFRDGDHYFTGYGPDWPVGSLPTGDGWLASRLPEVPDPFLPADAATNPPLWRFITKTLLGADNFDSPISGMPGMPPDPQVSLQQLTAGGTRPLAPTVINGMPVLARVDPATRRVIASWPFIPAADADGDGIPDCGLVKLLGGPIDGVTYYAGVRIVDNAAAVNASIAWSPSPTPPDLHSSYPGTSATLIPGDFFPTNIDLLDLLNDPREMDALNRYRWHGVDPSRNFAWPVEDGGRNRNDFQFTSPYEAMWMQLGRRLGNPGPTSHGAYCQALATSEAIALTRQFCLADPSSSPSILEQMLPLSTGRVGNRPASAYAPGAAVGWYNQNFNLDPNGSNAGPSAMPIRALLTVRSPVSNMCPCKLVTSSPLTMDTDPGVSPSVVLHGGVSAPPFGVAIEYSNPPARLNNPHVYVANFFMGGLFPVPPEFAYESGQWVMEPWNIVGNTPLVTKTAVNVASFKQLTLAYWSVMSEKPVDLSQFPPTGTSFPFYAGAALGTPPFPVTDPVSLAAAPSIAGKARMFRSPMRNGTDQFQMTPRQVMMLRASLAAVHTIDLRNMDDDRTLRRITSRKFQLPPDADPSVAGGKLQSGYGVTVYGYSPQPFITEVYANNARRSPAGAKPGIVPDGFIAIELHNPYPQPISLNGWVLQRIRRASNGVPSRDSSFSNLFTFNKSTVIPPGGYYVLVNTTAPPPGLQWVPQSGLYQEIPQLTRGLKRGPNTFTDDGGMFDSEMVLMRPRQADGTWTATPRFPPNFLSGLASWVAWDYSFVEDAPLLDGVRDGSPPPNDLVPADDYDFTGLLPPQNDHDPAHQNGWEWHYIRPNDARRGKAWHFVYPGRYRIDSSGANAGLPRFEATAYGPTGATVPGDDLSSLGAPDADAATLSGVRVPYSDRAIPLITNAGPAKPSASGPCQFPFGGFARNGDLLQVPFIGAYQVYMLDPQNDDHCIELNSISMDAAFADDNDPSDDTRQLGGLGGRTVPVENIGRFCPIDATDVSPSNPAASPVDDYAPPLIDAQGKPHPNPKWRYHWAMRLFDYLTVQAPQDDYLPDVDPNMADFAVPDGWPSNKPPPIQYKYPGQRPQPVANANPNVRNWQGPNGATEGLVPVDGLININTAPCRVLAAVPWVPRPAANAGAGAYAQWLRTNCEIARAIVQYRDGNPFARPQAVLPHGPFRSLFELNAVPIVRYGVAPAPAAMLLRDVLGPVDTKWFHPTDGRLVPYWAPGEPLPTGLGGNTAQLVYAPVYGDYSARFLELMRVSNLVTTRSDSFTVYVVVQGWKDAGTPGARLVAERRAAFVVDRSGVTPVNRSPATIRVPAP